MSAPNPTRLAIPHGFHHCCVRYNHFYNCGHRVVEIANGAMRYKVTYGKRRNHDGHCLTRGCRLLDVETVVDWPCTAGCPGSLVSWGWDHIETINYRRWARTNLGGQG
ncbi:hypothetical protein Hte_003869 [Hypoxylon texense]